MMKNQQMVKLFLSVLVCTLVIFSSSYFGSKIIGKQKNEVQQTTAPAKVKTQQASKPLQVDQEGVLNQATVTLKDIPEDLQSAISTNSKIEIPAQASFSLLGFVKKQKLATLSSETLSIISTGIYQTILPTNFSIEEHNISTILPDYAQLGDEAKVDFTKSLDLAFSNPNKTKYTLELQLNGNSLMVALKGEKFPYEYKIVKKNEQELSPKTIVQYSPLLTPGQTTLKSAGRNGHTIEVYRQVYKGELIINTESISNDYYPPEYRVEVHALNGTATQPSAAAGQTDASQSGTGNQDLNSQQTTPTTTTANGSTSDNSNDSNLWGKPNEETK